MTSTHYRLNKNGKWEFVARIERGEGIPADFRISFVRMFFAMTTSPALGDVKA